MMEKVDQEDEEEHAKLLSTSKSKLNTIISDNNSNSCKCSCNSSSNLLLRLQEQLTGLEGRLAQLNNSVLELQQKEKSSSKNSTSKNQLIRVESKLSALELKLNSIVNVQVVQDDDNDDDDEEDPINVDCIIGTFGTDEIPESDEIQTSSSSSSSSSSAAVLQMPTTTTNNTNNLSEEEGSYLTSSSFLSKATFKDRLSMTHQLQLIGAFYHCPEPDCDFNDVFQQNLKRHYDRSHVDPTITRCRYCDKILKVDDGGNESTTLTLIQWSSKRGQTLAKHKREDCPCSIISAGVGTDNNDVVLDEPIAINRKKFKPPGEVVVKTFEDKLGLIHRIEMKPNGYHDCPFFSSCGYRSKHKSGIKRHYDGKHIKVEDEEEGGNTLVQLVQTGSVDRATARRRRTPVAMKKINPAAGASVLVHPPHKQRNKLHCKFCSPNLPFKRRVELAKHYTKFHTNNKILKMNEKIHVKLKKMEQK